MELIAQYIEIDEPRRVDLCLPDIRPEWRAFHESNEHKISVFAGRQTGKTYNLALRAVRSQYDCIIFCHHRSTVQIMVDLIMQMSRELPLARVSSGSGSSTAYIEYENGRRIDIHVLPRDSSTFRGRRLMMKEVLFDEFDREEFGHFIEVMDYELRQAVHVVCVGSPSMNPTSMGKRWFNQSGTKYFIDARYIPFGMEEDYNRWDFFPSEMRQMIENLPPVDSL